MSESAVTDSVRAFYEQYPFPGVRSADREGLILMRRLARRPGPTRILDAGCGTGNTAIALARVMKDAEVLGVDVCRTSLERARAQAREAGLANVRFRSADLMNFELEEAQTFDVILCLGVLHHTADMLRALRNLSALLDDEGELYLWTYGAHGRHAHELNCRLISMLVDPAWSFADRISFARVFAEGTRDAEPLQCLYGRTDQRAQWRDVVLNDAWIADQFLHVHEQSLTMDHLLSLTEGAGLEIRSWLDLPSDATHDLPPAVALRMDQLERLDRFRAFDLLLKPRQYFVVTRKAGTSRRT